MDYIQTSAVDKMAKFLDKGLDPNYQDSDTGGKDSFHPPDCTRALSYFIYRKQIFSCYMDNI